MAEKPQQSQQQHQPQAAQTQPQPGSVQAQPAQPTQKPHKQRHRLNARRVLLAMGPGMVAALAGADAGGVATYSNAGALFGFG